MNFIQVAEARREADEKRNAKYAKMERQREEVRQNIREKVFLNNSFHSTNKSTSLLYEAKKNLLD